MPRTRRPLLATSLAAACLALAAAPVAGHATVEEGAQSAAAGGWFLWFRTVPGVVYEDEPFLVNLGVNRPDYSPGTGLDIDARGPVGALELRENGRGTYVATITVPEPGAYAVAFTLPDVNGTSNATWTANLSVYKDAGVSIAPADAAADYSENTTTDVAVVVLARGTAEPDPRARDLQVRFEHWSDDHKRLVFSDEAPARFAGGAWHARYDFPAVGMYHLRFASTSLGLDWPDSPYIHLYATPKLEPTAPPMREENEAPGLAALAALGALGAAALARRSREP